MLSDDCERDLLVSDVVRTVGAQVDASSDDELLMRPSSGRHVVPRMGEKEFNQVAEVGEPGAIDVGPRGMHAGPGHRRRLVVEVAPGVVDASAVALPDHVISDGESDCDASVPVFDPLDSDEEDELDALLRTGATQVDCDDEPMVCVGRSAPLLPADRVAGAQPTVSICEASQASASQCGQTFGDRISGLACPWAAVRSHP